MKRVLITLLLVLFLSFTSCSKLESIGYDLGKDLSGELLGEEPSKDPFEEHCERQATELIPTNIILYDISGHWYMKGFTFLDGEEDISVSIRYRYGEKEGENIHHLYPANLIEDNYAQYQKQIISSTGTIKGDRTFKAKLLVSPTEKPAQEVLDSKYGRDVMAKEFRVEEIEFKHCEWIN